MSNKVYISGGSRGIGFACAKKYSENGFTVGIGCSNRETGKKAISELRSIQNNVFLFPADLRNEEETVNSVKEYIKSIGVPDVLVLAAGIAYQNLFQYTDSKTYDNIMDINVKSNYLIIREFLPYMINRKSGSIITFSSILGESGASCEVIYSASKAAIIGMTKALAKEVAPSGIRVNSISPGVIKTEMTETLGEETLQYLKEETPLNRLGIPNDVAEAVFWLSSDKASFITGQVLSVNGGLVI